MKSIESIAAAMLTALSAALAPVPAAAQQSDTLGRLFFSPEQRATLERQRQLNLQQTETLEGDTLTLDGIVRRSSGRSTVWVNGIAQHNGAMTTGVRVELGRSDTASAVLSAGDEAPLSLKVGESANRSTRKKQDGLDGGRVTVKRAVDQSGSTRNRIVRQ